MNNTNWKDIMCFHGKYDMMLKSINYFPYGKKYVVETEVKTECDQSTIKTISSLFIRFSYVPNGYTRVYAGIDRMHTVETVHLISFNFINFITMTTSSYQYHMSLLLWRYGRGRSTRHYHPPHPFYTCYRMRYLLYQPLIKKRFLQYELLWKYVFQNYPVFLRIVA